MVLGILTPVLTCCCGFLALIPGILAIVFAVRSKNLSNGVMLGKATAGLVLGIIGLVLCLVSTVVGIINVVTVLNDPEYWKSLEEIYREMGMDIDLSSMYS